MVNFSKTQVASFRVAALCDECNGELEFSGSKLLVNPPLYRHHCTTCGR